MEAVNALGRRKAAVARIYVNDGKGNILVNNKDVKEYFPFEQLQYIVHQPLTLTNTDGKYDISVNLYGGGVKGQAEALRLAITRALVKIDPEHRSILKSNKLLTRDPRSVERKKPGRPKKEDEQQ